MCANMLVFQSSGFCVYVYIKNIGMSANNLIHMASNMFVFNWNKPGNIDQKYINICARNRRNIISVNLWQWFSVVLLCIVGVDEWFNYISQIN